MKDPFEEPLRNLLKNSDEVGIFYEDQSNPEFLKPMLIQDSIKGYAADGKRHYELGKLGSFYDGIIIRLEQDGTADDLIRSHIHHFDAIVTLNDISEGTVEGITIITGSGDYSWTEVLQSVTAKGRIFESNKIEENQAVWKTAQLVEGFVKGYSFEVVRRLLELHDPDQTLAVLGDSFLDYFSKQCDSVSKCVGGDVSSEDLFFAALELLVHGFQSAYEMKPVIDSVSGFGSCHVESICEAVLETSGRSERERLELMREKAVEQYASHRERFRSATKYEEDESDLPASIKAKIFVNAVREIKNAGIHVTIPVADSSGKLVALISRYEDPIILTTADEERAEAYFESVEDLSSWSLLSTFEACVRVYVENKCTGHSFDEKGFYAERAMMIPFLFKHIYKIAKELKNRYAVDYPRRLGFC